MIAFPVTAPEHRILRSVPTSQSEDCFCWVWVLIHDFSGMFLNLCGDQLTWICIQAIAHSTFNLSDQLYKGSFFDLTCIWWAAEFCETSDVTSVSVVVWRARLVMLLLFNGNYISTTYLQPWQQTGLGLVVLLPSPWWTPLSLWLCTHAKFHHILYRIYTLFVERLSFWASFGKRGLRIIMVTEFTFPIFLSLQFWGIIFLMAVFVATCFVVSKVFRSDVVDVEGDCCWLSINVPECFDILDSR